uniref:Uncharacterized protein n=1 Tax=Sphaerodactylus townsendi TaxID=933632 RepID=A0ACB8G9M9_9SAUR
MERTPLATVSVKQQRRLTIVTNKDQRRRISIFRCRMQMLETSPSRWQSLSHLNFELPEPSRQGMMETEVQTSNNGGPRGLHLKRHWGWVGRWDGQDTIGHKISWNHHTMSEIWIRALQQFLKNYKCCKIV